MRRSCHEQNRKMLQAYQHFHRGELNQSLSIYETLLQKSSAPDFRSNLICTISVISCSMGNYNYALQIMQENVQEVPQGLTKLRYFSNLCFVYVVNAMYEQAVHILRKVKEIIFQEAKKNNDVVGFVMKLFFRVDSLEELQKYQSNNQQETLMQAFWMMNTAFAKQMIGFSGAAQLLKKAYAIFIFHNKIQLAVVCIRQLLLMPLPIKQTTKLQKQLSKVMSIEISQNYQLDNAQIVQCCKFIAQDLVSLIQQLNLQNNNYSSNESLLWKIALAYQSKKLTTNTSLCEQEKSTIVQNIQVMILETNSIVISEMRKTDFYVSAIKQIQGILMNFGKLANSLKYICVQESFKKLFEFTQKQSLFKVNRSKSQILKNSDKMEKQNRAPCAIVRSRSGKPLTAQKSNKKQGIIKVIQKQQRQSSKFVYKAVKFCEYGSFLSKRNFNSDGGQYRFVRVTHSILKWAKNPEKIQESCQIYPLKDIVSIHYGKCTPTLLKQANHLLKQQLCFSLKLQKRTLDFYCKDFQQTCNWVCGFSHKLKQINPKIQGYSRGKMLWKRMFMLLRQKYTNNIRMHQAKHYYVTAYAIISYGKHNQNN